MTLDDIQTMVFQLAELVSAPASYLPTFGYTDDFARPHIEVDDRGYHYVVVERGREFERRTTSDIKELLYWIFKHATRRLASSYELNNRISGQDFRRLLFGKHVELIGMIDPDFAPRLESEYQLILRDHPFEDTDFMSDIIKTVISRRNSEH